MGNMTSLPPYFTVFEIPVPYQNNAVISLCVSYITVPIKTAFRPTLPAATSLMGKLKSSSKERKNILNSPLVPINSPVEIRRSSTMDTSHHIRTTYWLKPLLHNQLIPGSNLGPGIRFIIIFLSSSSQMLEYNFKQTKTASSPVQTSPPVLLFNATS
jgi:hypothetical protein